MISTTDFFYKKTIFTESEKVHCATQHSCFYMTFRIKICNYCFEEYIYKLEVLYDAGYFSYLS